MVDTGRESKLKDEMIEDFVGGGAACVFACRVCLCEARKMIDHSQYVFENYVESSVDGKSLTSMADNIA